MKLALWTASTMLLAAGTVVYFIWDNAWAWWLYDPPVDARELASGDV